MLETPEAPQLAADTGSSGRLDSWKEIAAYLKRDVRTVQRWEKDERLPIHRHPHKRLGAIYAYKTEIDAWWHNGHSSKSFVGPTQAATGSLGDAGEGLGEQPAERPGRGLTWAWIAAVVAAFAVLSLLTSRFLSRPEPPRISSILPVTRDLFWKGSVACDGRRAYYTYSVSGRTFLASLTLDQYGGGLPAEFPVALENPQVLAVSPRGTHLLLRDDVRGEASQVMVLSPSDRGLRKLAGVNASCAAWSPQDDWVAFGNGKSIFRVKDGGKPETLAIFAGVPRSLAWSPDGRFLRALVTTPEPPAASGRAKDSVSLWQIDARSKRISPLALPEEARRDCGGSIVWTSSVFVLASRCLHSSALWMLPQRQSLFRKPPAWTKLGPEFGRLAQIASTGNPNELLVVEEQSGPLQLTRYDPENRTFAAVTLGVNPVEVDYSRDGRWVTYVEYPQRTLWRSRADGSDRLQLTFPPLRAQLPHWSPDGTSIAFTGLGPGTSWQTYLIAANGGAPRRATPGSGDEGSPTWSPDGQQLVFGDIEIDDPQSHFLRRLEIRTGKTTSLPNSTELRTARWSPDGRSIAAIRYSRQELVLYDVNTAKWTTVAGGVVGDTLNWSADSRYVYFDFPYEPHSGIYRYDVRKRSVEQALRYGPIRRIPNVMNDTSGFSLAPDGSIVLNASMQSSRMYVVRLSLD